ncbi:hypothetical protein RND71_025936 [Anisodus tanguticus]|uniref:Inositol-1-monophosphatase n=1 Tax=Anisodus tanguticus TaxID=243964 RepID=A0AAE1RMJ3_9SOLA|nr:hypothetical protein RND71_025936 [Anisodus tanguticus]
MAQNGSLEEFLAVAVDAAKKAGEVICHGFYQTKYVEHKGQTDKACEDLIFNHPKQHFPSHKFIGEETTAALGAFELTDEPTWIVDPLDGTTNFVHGFSLEFMENVLFSMGSLSNAGTKRDKLTVDATTSRINSLLFKVRSLRMCGSCALNLCGVACGRLDLFYEIEFGGPWDAAEFDITARRVAATNAHLKDAFIESLQQSE